MFFIVFQTIIIALNYTSELKVALCDNDNLKILYKMYPNPSTSIMI